MATRPVFAPNSGSGPLVRRIDVSLTWNGGFALVQSRKNIAALHEGAGRRGVSPVLEISSKSEHRLGVRLSAFNLLLDHPQLGKLPVEAAFQGSKVFEDGGPYNEFYGLQGRAIKKDPRLKESGALTHFDLVGQKWALQPLTAFYDWLYVTALSQNPDLHEPMLQYAGFTDIAFNPKKSINCQARSAALFVELHCRGVLSDALESQDRFLEIAQQNRKKSAPAAQNPSTPRPMPNHTQISKRRGRSKKALSETIQYELFAPAA